MPTLSTAPASPNARGSSDARSASDADIAVVGAGIVGVCCALALARQGQRVLVLDPQPPGMGASFGNASHLATEQVFPIADAGILKRLPCMLLDPLGPLRLDWRHLPRGLPWFARLLWNLRPAPYRASVAGLGALNGASLGAWQRLLASVDAAPLLHQQGSVLAYEKPESLALLTALAERTRAQGVPVEPWDAAKLHAAAPTLSPRLRGGLFFPATGHFLNPLRVVETVAEAARREGVRFVRERVQDAHTSADGVTLTTAQRTLRVDRVLIACGAHSAALTEALTGVRVPLDTERGYHLMLPREPERLPFAVTAFERRFIMTPLPDGLRLAGTVEFAGLERPPNLERAWQLHRLSKGLFTHELDITDASTWMGFRPSLPDSLPIIDRARGGRVLLAFGHQHLGLTQAAISAEMIAALATPGDAPLAPSNPDAAHDLPAFAPYRLTRFGRER
ncbi:FAD-dependent oxidoreductase [Salinicola sp. JS01]|uniref:NAD(P)/FAD-dependent oxidoreductase n=1 Tax=Salinicola sp. JS01 TaxID=3050071 RepID=UPI00255B874A|nr:FAD-dependent oxidoreductase [Salinicola sp. JS01]WIX32933.1 FAD-dependent oxidoreductase [Salinicola sp. JS01]